MDFEDFSDDSLSDLDYKPPGEEEVLSEIDSDDEINDDYGDGSASTSVIKSKKTSMKRTKRKKGSQKKFKKNEIKDVIVEKTEDKEDILPKSSEEDKKRLDALWEEFQRPVPKLSTSNTSENKSKLKVPTIISDKPETTKKRNFEELFDSSDSSKKVLNEDDNTTEIKSPEPKNLIAPIVKKTTGGLANVLTQIGKKNKLTVLEKSKQDWDSYKKKEGIVEELITHNKGKDGFLEKRDFLERTDLRQFELEKSMRATNRARRNQ